ncbi:MAG: NosD domain-containing protein [Promethearchaeota archaeon]
MIKINRKVKISGIVGLLILSSIFLANISFTDRASTRTINPTTSAIWTANFIHVQNNWSSFTEITGDGSWDTPYLIENVIMDASTSPTDSGILIEDEKSNYFKILNCTVINWGASNEDGGIKLYNSDNGFIENNTCSDPGSGSGIVLLGDITGTDHCDNNSLYENVVDNNAARGIFVELYCEENRIYDNEVHNNLVGISMFDHCSNNNITDNSVTDNSRGIELAYASNSNNVEFNEIESNQWGIYIYEECDSNTLYNNTITDSVSSGIYINGDYLKRCTGNVINKNYIRNNNYDGILCEYTEYSVISDNIIIDNNHMGIEFDTRCEWNNIIGNTINSNGDGIIEAGIMLWNYCNDNNITLNSIEDNWEYGIHIGSMSDNNLINNNTIKNHDWGIRFYSGCDGNTITYNNITDNSGPSLPYAITIVYECLTNTISYNFIDNTVSGIILDQGVNFTDIVGNTISNCARGIFIQTTDCEDNEVWSNNFISNTVQARDNSGPFYNYWYKGTIGNYWDDYSGIDCNHDGIGDTPYNILGAAGNQDLYPLYTQPLPILDEHNIGSGTLYTTGAPIFNLTVTVYSLNEAWYRLSDDTIFTDNQTIATLGTNVTIDSGLWDQMADGTVTIWFYADDPCGYLGELNIEVKKDATGPQINVILPTNNSERLIDDRSFEYTVDGTQDTVWYSIEGGPNHIITSNGLFDQNDWETAWNATASDEYFMIEFFANDTHGNIDSVVIYVSPTTNESPDPKIPFGYTFLLVGLVAAVTIGIVVNKKITKK